MTEYMEQNRSELLAYKKEYGQKHKARLNSKKANHLQNNVGAKLSHALRTRLSRAIKSSYKNGSAVKDLGCSVEELKIYLEKQFKPGMTWKNWGRFGWHIDHIKPLSKFDLTDREQFLKATYYSNLQPLWWYENIKKHARI